MKIFLARSGLGVALVAAALAAIGPAMTLASEGPAADSQTLPASRAARQASQQFIDDAASSNRAEIQEAQFMLQHTRSTPVRQFARKIIRDHTLALEQLQQLAQRVELTVPAGISSDYLGSFDALKQQHGRALDSAYLERQEQDHAEVIQRFEQAEHSTAMLAGVRDYVRATLPHLQQHLRMARQLVATQSNGRRPAG
jgi:putative membrane protein